MPNDEDENTVHGLDDGQKYKLLKFWKGCDLSKHHLESVSDVVEIGIARASESTNDRLSAIEKSISDEIAAREQEDALVRQTFSHIKYVFGTIIAILSLCVGYLGLK